jgi:hypothetical protein
MDDEGALWQIFSKYFCFPCQSFHQLLQIHHHPSSGAVTRCHIVADMSNGLSLAPYPKEKYAFNTYLSHAHMCPAHANLPVGFGMSQQKTEK